MGHTNKLNNFNTVVKFKLSKKLTDLRESIIKYSNFKFQTYYPIMHQDLVNLYFKKMFIAQSTFEKSLFNQIKSNELVKQTWIDLGLIFPQIYVDFKIYSRQTVELCRQKLKHFTKSDLDSMQSLLLALFFIMKMLNRIEIRNRLGHKCFRQVAMDKYIENTESFNYTMTND